MDSPNGTPNAFPSWIPLMDSPNGLLMYPLMGSWNGLPLMDSLMDSPNGLPLMDSLMDSPNGFPWCSKQWWIYYFRYFQLWKYSKYTQQYNTLEAIIISLPYHYHTILHPCHIITTLSHIIPLPHHYHTLPRLCYSIPFHYHYSYHTTTFTIAILHTITIH